MPPIIIIIHQNAVADCKVELRQLVHTESHPAVLGKGGGSELTGRPVTATGAQSVLIRMLRFKQRD